MITWAGGLIALCGLGHTVGALVPTVPRFGAEWIGLVLWQPQHNDALALTSTAAAFWYTWYSFGPLLLLAGLIVLWLGIRGVTPPRFVAWALAGWTVVGTVLSGLSPLILLLPAAVLLLIGAHRAARRERTTPAVTCAA
jgi:hypothetical protein